MTADIYCLAAFQPKQPPSPAPIDREESWRRIVANLRAELAEQRLENIRLQQCLDLEREKTVAATSAL